MLSDRSRRQQYDLWLLEYLDVVVSAAQSPWSVCELRGRACMRACMRALGARAWLRVWLGGLVAEGVDVPGGLGALVRTDARMA